MLEKGIVYVARLIERLELRPNLSGAANPKSSTGRLDIFTRLIVDGAEAFDDVPLDYKGRSALEISPRSFSVRVQAGSKLNQVRFRSRHPQQRERHTFTLTTPKFASGTLSSPLVDGELDLREGVMLQDRSWRPRREIVGYRAIKEQRRHRCRVARAATPSDGFLGADPRPRGPAADPRSRRVLHSRLAREDADPGRSRRRNGADRPGDRRVSRPLRRLLRSRLRPGRGRAARPRARCWKCAAATCRSCSKTASRSAASSTKNSPARRTSFMASDASSNYQHQGLKLSKHFRV